MKIEIIFSTKKSKWMLLSAVIRWFQGVPFSHCAILINNSFIFESTEPRSRLLSLSEWSGPNKIIASFDVGLLDPYDLFLFIAQRSNKPYSMLQLIWIVLANFGKVVKVRNNGKAFVCSELVYELMELKGVFIDKPKDLITLRDIYRECRKIASPIER